MKVPITMSVNDRACNDEIEPRTLLIYYLRDHLGLTGSHVGCDTSNCGACTVLLDGAAVKACTVFAVQASGHTVKTIEGLAQGDKLHPLQEAFWNEHGLQCGFCTPGMIMAGLALLERNADPSKAEVHAAIEGNLCRCTGYNNIVKSIQAASRAGQEASSASDVE